MASRPTSHRPAMRRPRWLTVALVAALAACGPSTPTTPPPASTPPIATASAAVDATASASTVPSARETASTLDGAWLLFEWYAGRSVKDVVLVRPDGSGRHAIATDVAVGLEHADASWAPDGQTIVFDAGALYDGVSIWTTSIDGTDAKQLLGPDARCRLGVAFPSYAPDGRALLYVCQDGTSGTSADVHETLEVLNLETGARTPVVTFRGREEIVGPSWSRDGTTAVFTVNYWSEDLSTQTGSSIATVPVTGGEVRFLTPREAWATSPHWSPSGDVIVYGTRGYGEKDMSVVSTIATIRADATNAVTIWPGTVRSAGRLGAPWWALDGSGLIVSVATGTDGIEDIHAGTLSLDRELGPLAAGTSGVGSRRGRDGYRRVARNSGSTSAPSARTPRTAASRA